MAQCEAQHKFYVGGRGVGEIEFKINQSSLPYAQTDLSKTVRVNPSEIVQMQM